MSIVLVALLGHFGHSPKATQRPWNPYEFGNVKAAAANQIGGGELPHCTYFQRCVDLFAIRARVLGNGIVNSIRAVHS